MVLTVWLFLALLSVGEGTSEWVKGRVCMVMLAQLVRCIRSYSSATVVIQVSCFVHVC